jgi:hypothetical protein
VVRECGFKRNLPPIFLGQLFSDYLGAELSCTFSIEFVAEVFGICGPEITWTFLAAGKPERIECDIRASPPLTIAKRIHGRR